MHDLLRGWAREDALAREPEPVRRCDLTRGFDHYRRILVEATNLLDPGEAAYRVRYPDRPGQGQKDQI